MDVTDMEKWAEAIKSLGFPIFVACVMLYFLWRVGRWVGDRADPIIKAHVGLVDSVRETNGRMADTQDRILTVLEAKTTIVSVGSDTAIITPGPSKKATQIRPAGESPIT